MERQERGQLLPLSDDGVIALRRCGPIVELTVDMTSKRYSSSSYSTIAVLPEVYKAYDTMWSPDIKQFDNGHAMFQVGNGSRNFKWAQMDMAPNQGHWTTMMYFTPEVASNGTGEIT